jgi:hypothetical protein
MSENRKFAAILLFLAVIDVFLFLAFLHDTFQMVI